MTRPAAERAGVPVAARAGPTRGARPGRAEGGVGIACVGAGTWGRHVVRNLADLGVLSRVCDTDGDRRDAAARTHPGVEVTDRLERVLDDPGTRGVVIATPAASHGELVRRALRAGKDVLVEKPLCLSVTEGEELVALARETGRILMVGHLLWYHPAVLELQRLVEAGELGRIRYIYSNRLNLGRIRRAENILWSFAPHDVSVILGLVGEEPEEVRASGGHYLHDRIADVTVSVLGFPSGVRAHLFVSWLHPFKEQRLVVVGDRQMAVFNDLEETEKLLLFPHGIDWRNNAPVANRAEAVAAPFAPGEPLALELAAFERAIRTRVPPRTDGEEGLRVLRVLGRCQEELERAQAPPPGRANGGRPSARVHASAYVDAGASLGPGTTVWHFSHVREGARVGRDCRIGQNVVVGPRVRIGDGVKIQNNVSVYEGVTLEDGVFCGPSMVFTNVRNPRSEVPRMHELRPTLVRRGATLGANCTVLCGVTIGRHAFVGAGAVVLRDVPDHGLVVGNPARLVGWMCRCGERIEDAEDDRPPGPGREDARGGGHGGARRGACRACGRAYVTRDGGLREATGSADRADDARA